MQTVHASVRQPVVQFELRCKSFRYNETRFVRTGNRTRNQNSATVNNIARI